MKIFMGMHNIASLMHDYAAGFRALGHEVFCVAEDDNAIRNYEQVDLIIPRMTAAAAAGKKLSPQAAAEHWLRYRKLAWQKALEADVCFFIWNTFESDAGDLPVLRKMGKKIIVRFCGSEVRDMEANRQAFLHYGAPYTEYGQDRAVLLPRHLHYLRMCERYAHLLICSSNMSLRPTFGRACLLFQADSTLCNIRQRERPLILHAPSKKATKGTQGWLEIFDELRAAGLHFDIRLLENIPHKEMAQEYANADIFCNSLFYGGRASNEALAAGCVVLSSDVSQTYQDYVRSSAADNMRGLGLPPGEAQEAWWWRRQGYENILSRSPVVGVKPHTAAKELAALISDLPRRQALAEKGPSWVAEAFSPAVACREILDQLADPGSLEKRARLFWNPFFNRRYTPERDTPEQIALFNKYTGMVRGCRWYKDYVIPCERGGLRF